MNAPRPASPVQRSVARAALREAGAGAAAILAGLFIIDVVNDPVADIMAALPASLGAAALIGSARTIRSARRAPGTAAPPPAP